MRRRPRDPVVTVACGVDYRAVGASPPRCPLQCSIPERTCAAPFTHVIVNAKSTVFEKATELRALIVGIGDCRVQRTARIDVCALAIEPVIEELQDGSRKLRPTGCLLLVGQLATLSFDVE